MKLVISLNNESVLIPISIMLLNLECMELEELSTTSSAKTQISH